MKIFFEISLWIFEGQLCYSVSQNTKMEGLDIRIFCMLLWPLFMLEMLYEVYVLIYVGIKNAILLSRKERTNIPSLEQI